jgi:hypothetical protein
LQKPKSINELLSAGGQRLSKLKARAAARTQALEHVRQALLPPLSETVVSAGCELGRLTIGVAGAAWAARLRYATDMLRRRVGASMGIEIHSVKIKVVPPSANRR